MGQSATAYLGYGIEFSEGTVLPWGKRYWDLPDWWLAASGYKPTNNPFDEEGEWRKDLAKGEREALADAMHAEKKAWREAHPCPVELFICGSDEAYSTVVCVRGSLRKTDWDNTLVVSKHDLVVNPEFLLVFDEFCKKYELQGERAWRLGASFG